MAEEGFSNTFNFSSRSDSLSIGAEATVDVEMERNYDEEEEDDDRIVRSDGGSKRRRIHSLSEEDVDDAPAEDEGGAGGDTADGDSTPPDVVNNNPLQPDEQEPRHPAPGSRGSPVYLCANKLTNNTFQCKFCKKQMTCNQGTTTSVSSHMIRFHAAKPDVIKMVKILDEKRQNKEEAKKEKEAKAKEDGKQLSMKGFVTGGKPVDPVRKKNINARLIDFMVARNESFSVVEDPFFRALMFELEPGLVVMSRTSATRASDERAALARDKLRTEIQDDLKKAGHTTICITSDHGTSRDNHRTRKNALTLSRTLDDFSVKTDTLDLIICEESQTGANIRQSVKESLVKWAGYDPEKMTVNWVTDNEAKQVSARNPLHHRDSGLFVHFEAGCIDHLIDLAVSDTLKNSFEMEHSVNIARDIVNYMKESSLSRVKLMEIAENLGMKPLSIVKGTLNRWFHKYFEIHRFLDLEQAIKEFQADNLPTTLGQVNLEDWDNLRVYVQSLKPIVDAATMLESETSCTGSSVIPFITAIVDDLENLKGASRNRIHTNYYAELARQLSRRFPNQFKTVTPFNALCILDPRYLDIYFNAEETNHAKNIIIGDRVYHEEHSQGWVSESDAPAVPIQSQGAQTKAQSLRTKLLQKRFIDTQTIAARNNAVPFEEKMEKEFKDLLDLKYRGIPDTDSNPSAWWRENQKQFPLLSKFWKAYSSFPATSTASERVFNVDGLVISPRRYTSLVS